MFVPDIIQEFIAQKLGKILLVPLSMIVVITTAVLF
jgi:hypothetical protein